MGRWLLAALVLNVYASTPIAAEVISEDFNVACNALQGFWRFVDPIGDSTYAITGVGTSDASLELSVPAGTWHDAWVSGPDAPRVMQAADNTDFELEVKLTSTVSEKFQGQGLVVQQSDDHFLRFGFYSDGNTVKVVTAILEAGVATVLRNSTITPGAALYLRVLRVGDQWTHWYSFDGQTWSTSATFSHVMTVNEVGAYALNSGRNAPAHTAVVDYFFNTASPIVPEDGAVLGEAGEKVLMVDIVGQGTVMPEPDLATYSCGQEVTLTALPTAGQAFGGWSGDGVNTTNPLTVTMTDDRFITATFEPESGPPSISGLDVQGGATTAVVTWTTDVPATSRVGFGETLAYELDFVEAAALVTSHSLTLTGLTPDTLYHVMVISMNASDLPASSDDFTFQTTPQQNSNSPVIDIWYGPFQSFGFIGLPQPWINILGNVFDPNGINSLTYSLNSGPENVLSIGPDSRRLADPGDFNVNINEADLVDGTNTVVIRAVDTFGNESTEAVEVDYFSNNIWPETYSIDWSTVSEIQEVSQIVDGLWELDGDTIKPLQMAYDRLVAIGDLQWDDYEVTVPITIYGINPSGFASPSSGPGVGILLRWQGHVDWGGSQPIVGWWPLGAIGWFRWRGNPDNYTTRVQIMGNQGSILANKHRSVTVGVTYLFKMRVETIPGVGGFYSLKIWEEGQREPDAWDLTAQETLNDPQFGSVVLVAHEVDCAFGDVTVVPLN